MRIAMIPIGYVGVVSGACIADFGHEVSAQCIERGPPISPLGAAYAVILVNLDDITTHSAGNLAQLALLIGRGLIESGDSEIHNRPAHGFSPSRLRASLPYLEFE